MTDTIKADRGIPIPKPRSQERKYPWHTMNVGDSFAFPADIGETSARTSVSHANRRYGKKRFSIRRLDDNTLRCWRVK
jgi:hypothetical protein